MFRNLNVCVRWILKQSVHGHEARVKMLKGMSLALEAAQSTYGPCGWTVAVDYHAPEIRSTKCGASILEDFSLSDPYEDAGAQLLCHVARQQQKYTGDGTTLAAILTHSIAVETFRRNWVAENVAEVGGGLRRAAQMVEKYITRMSRPLSGPGELASVARCAAGLDDALAQLIAEGFSSAEDPSAVFLLPSKTSSCEIVKGIILDVYLHDRFDHPYRSIAFTDPCLILYPSPLENWRQIENKLEDALESGADVLIAAQRVCPTFRASIPRGIDQNRLHILSLTLSRLPFELANIQERLRFRRADLNGRIVMSNNKLFIELFACELERQATTSAVLISIGEIGETPSQERMERATQCAASVRAALRDGRVAGGASVLLDAARWLGSQTVDDIATSKGIAILRKALVSPMTILIDSAGEPGAQYVENILSSSPDGQVFDLRERTLHAADAVGVLDATAVVVAAVRVSSSIAGLIALTEVLVTQRKEMQRRPCNPQEEDLQH